METTGNAQVTSTSVGLRYGLLTALVSIIITFALSAAQLETSPLRYLTSVVLIAGIVLAQREFKARNAGFMEYGQGVGLGVTLSAVVGLLSTIYTYVYTNFVDPDMMARTMEKVRADMEAKGTMSDAQIDQAMAISSKFTSGPVMLIFIVVGSIFIGLIISLISSAFIKNAKPEFE